MKIILLILTLTAIAAGFSSESYGQHNFNEPNGDIVYNLERNIYLSDPDMALLETLNDSLYELIYFKDDSLNALNTESKTDLADPNKDLKISDNEKNVLTAKFKNDSEDNIQKNELCIIDLGNKNLYKEGTDTIKIETDIEFLNQKNLALKSKLNNYFNSPGEIQFNSFKNGFDNELELVTNAIIELSVYILK